VTPADVGSDTAGAVPGRFRGRSGGNQHGLAGQTTRGGATLVTITEAGRARVAQVLPDHIQVANALLFAPLSDQDLHALNDIMTRVRDHMRAQPPRSAATRKRRDPPPQRPATS